MHKGNFRCTWGGGRHVETMVVAWTWGTERAVSAGSLSIPSVSGAKSGFSLIELLTVITVISVMAVLTGPALMRGGASRAGAANVVMNVFEQARAVSMQGMGRTYVVFRQSAFPERDAVMIFRAEDAGVREISRWQFLPAGVVLHSLPGVPQVALNGNLTAAHPAWADWEKLPAALRSHPGRLSVLEFTASGTLGGIGNGDPLVVLAEGHREVAGADAALRTPSGASGIFDVVAVTSFSGRPYFFTASRSDLENPADEL